MQKRQIITNFSITIVILLVLLSFAELIIRTTEDYAVVATLLMQKDYVSLHKNSDNAILSYELNADSTISNKYSINNLGFRDITRELTKSNHTIRIAVIGDSVTFGHEVTLNQTYPKKLEKLLLSSGHLVEVWNMGISGYNAFQKNYLVKKAINEFDADMIIYQHFIDDFNPNAVLFDSNKIKQVPVDALVNLTEIEAFSLYMPNIFPVNDNTNQELLKKWAFYRFVNIKIYNILSKINSGKYPNNAYFYYNKRLAESYNEVALNDTFEFTDKNSVPLIVVIPTLLTENYQNQYHKKHLLFNLIQKYQVDYIDMYTQLKRKNIKPSSFVQQNNPQDDVHPNAKGHYFYASQILFTLRNYI